jgi:hypothetical protein
MKTSFHRGRGRIEQIWERPHRRCPFLAMGYGATSRICDTGRTLESKREKGNLTEAEMEERLSNGKPIEMMGPPGQQRDYIQRAWREQLLRLHHEDNHMKPLLGSIKSILYVYRRTRDGDDDQGTRHQDISREFEAEMYPDVPAREIKLRWRDILVNPPEAFRARD